MGDFSWKLSKNSLALFPAPMKHFTWLLFITYLDEEPKSDQLPSGIGFDEWLESQPFLSRSLWCTHWRDVFQHEHQLLTKDHPTSRYLLFCKWLLQGLLWPFGHQIKLHLFLQLKVQIKLLQKWHWFQIHFKLTQCQITMIKSFDVFVQITNPKHFGISICIKRFSK